MFKNLFEIIMEADGDLNAFDASAPDDTAIEDTPIEDSSPPVDDGPPPMGEDEELGFDDSMGDDMGMDDGGDVIDDEEAVKDKKKLSDKANDILNQKLYEKFTARNNDISNIIENIQMIIPILPIETVREIDMLVGKLEKALDRGKDYVIDNYLNSDYGSNTLFFEKIDVVYTLICDEINTILKKYKSENKTKQNDDSDDF